MKRNLIAFAALVGLLSLGACKSQGGGAEMTTSDTATVPTTDTVVRTTTTTVDTVTGVNTNMTPDTTHPDTTGMTTTGM